MKIVLICAWFSLVHAQLHRNYTSRREDILREELTMAVGGNIVLDDNETAVNEVLMKWKRQELDEVRANPQYYNFSRSYFEYRDDIRNSKVYKFIQRMPKGAALHIHATAVLGPDYYINITYREHLHVCFEKVLKFKFALTPPVDACETPWKLMSDVRKSLDNVTKFDLDLRNNFTLVNTGNVESMWKQFNAIFRTISNLWTYRPIWEEYIYDVLQEFRNDNVMYVELRNFLAPLYELDGRKHDELLFANITNRVVERFVSVHPDFIGAKIICAFSRSNNAEGVEKYLKLTIKSKSMFPDFIAGFDLVGREDLGGPLVEILPQLEAGKADLDFFFHAGETNWYGTSTDENLIDAVLLGTKRIGHAYALVKHPLILEEIKTKNIGLEINLVSNNVLGLVHDMRNHPFAMFISQGLPVVLSSDDPGLWGAEPLSTDFYVGFMGVASHSHDLRLLKQLALNSIEYSALTAEKKKTAYEIFGSKWISFVNAFIEDMASIE